MGVFDGFGFSFVGFSGSEKAKFIEIIEEEGGEHHLNFRKNTDFLIATPKAVETTVTVKSAFARGDCSVVGTDYITKCSEQQTMLDSAPFEFKNPATTGAAEASSSKKRKAEEKEDEEDDEEEEEKEEKKVEKVEEPAAKKKKVVTTGKVPVDEESGLETSGKVYVNGNDIWSATLNQTDIGNNNNKFYIIQLIESGSSYYVFNRWGRVSAKGQSKLSKMGSLQKAKDDFAKKFKDKTGNEWSKRSTFKFKKGKYDWVDIDYSEDNEDEKEEEESDDEAKEEKKVTESKLDKRVQDLVKFISNKSFIDQTLREFEIDTNKMPLGKLSKKQIQSGYEVLKKIQDVIEGKNDDDDLESLSSRFYTIIPHQFGHRQVPTVIKTKTQLENKIKLVESLGEIEIASKIISKKSDQNIIDSIYGDLKTDITPIAKNSEEWKWIDTYIQNTHAPTHSYYTLELEDAFVVNRHGEAEKYIEKSEKIGNKQLLFHGSRSTNFVGILSQGLRIAPPEAPATGYMFGKGVYFADMCSKSANYCHAHLSDNSGLLLLTEVALGKTYNRTQAEFVTKLPKDLHSCWGQGGTQPDENEFLEIDSSCDGQKIKVPLGKPTDVKRSGSLLYNEFIIYDTAQANLRYLIKCKFHNKKH